MFIITLRQLKSKNQSDILWLESSVIEHVASTSVSQGPVFICAVSLDVDSSDTLTRLCASWPLLFLTMRAAVSVALTGGLQQGVVGNRHRLVQQGVQRLLIDAGFRKLHLRLKKTVFQK